MYIKFVFLDYAIKKHIELCNLKYTFGFYDMKFTF